MRVQVSSKREQMSKFPIKPSNRKEAENEKIRNNKEKHASFPVKT